MQGRGSGNEPQNQGGWGAIFPCPYQQAPKRSKASNEDNSGDFMMSSAGNMTSLFRTSNRLAAVPPREGGVPHHYDYKQGPHASISPT